MTRPKERLLATWLQFITLLVVVASLITALMFNHQSTQVRLDAMAKFEDQSREVLIEIQEVQKTQKSEFAAHRDRNELLHDCIADLIIFIIQAESRDDLLTLENPCPEPIEDLNDDH